MTKEKNDNELSMWFSTYGLLTAQRIFERFKITLGNDELVAAFKNPRSIYYLLLRVPLKNVFNGIILQQAHDYQVYAQKLFVDYLLSGEGNKDADSPGAITREDLEAERQKLMTIGASFNQDEVKNQDLIFDSQASLIKLSEGLQNSLKEASMNFSKVLSSRKIEKDEALIGRAIRSGIIRYDQINDDVLAVSSPFWDEISKILEVELIEDVRRQLADVMTQLSDSRNDIEDILSTYLEKVSDMFMSLRHYRTQFYEIIIKTTELIQLLPDYKIDKEKDVENRSTLYFDSHIGEGKL